MLKSFDGAHGQPDGAELHPWRDCTLVSLSSQTHPKNVPVRPSCPDFIAVPTAGRGRWNQRVIHTQRVASRVRLGSQRWPFSASRVWCTAQHLIALDLHALAPFATVSHSPRWSRPGDLQARGCRPVREQDVSPHIFLHFLALSAPESLLRFPTSNMNILPAKQTECDLCGLHGSAIQRLPLENWSAIVLRKTWRYRLDTHVQIYISICVYLCLHLYYYIWNDIYLYMFQLLAVLLTIYTYGYTHNSICVLTSTEIMFQCFRTHETTTIYRVYQWSNDQIGDDFVFDWLTRSNAISLIQHQKITWLFWNLDQSLRLLMEYLLLYDNFLIASLQDVPLSYCLSVIALTDKPNDGEWWGVIGPVFVLSISEFNWILRFKIRVRSFYNPQPPQDANFELFGFVPPIFLVLLLFCKIRNKVQYDD